MEIENTINIGSQTSGAGAGKAKFDPITESREILTRLRPCYRGTVRAGRSS